VKHFENVMSIEKIHRVMWETVWKWWLPQCWMLRFWECYSHLKRQLGNVEKFYAITIKSPETKNATH